MKPVEAKCLSMLLHHRKSGLISRSRELLTIMSFSVFRAISMQILYYSSHFKSLKHMCNFKSIGTSFQGSTLLVFNEATCAV